MLTQRLPRLVLLLALGGCGDNGGIEPPSVLPVNLGGIFQATTIDNKPLPLVFYYRDCPNGQARIGQIESAKLTLADEMEDPAIPDSVHLYWKERFVRCDLTGWDTSHLAVWGTFVAWRDSVVFDWRDPEAVDRVARRGPGGILTLRVRHREAWLSVRFKPPEPWFPWT